MTDGIFIPYFSFIKICRLLEQAQEYNKNGNTLECGTKLDEIDNLFDKYFGE